MMRDEFLMMLLLLVLCCDESWRLADRTEESFDSDCFTFPDGFIRVTIC